MLPNPSTVDGANVFSVILNPKKSHDSCHTKLTFLFKHGMPSLIDELYLCTSSAVRGKIRFTSLKESLTQYKCKMLDYHFGFTRWYKLAITIRRILQVADY